MSAPQAALSPPAAGAAPELHVHWLGRVAYAPTWRAMQRYTQERTADSADQLWLLDHVFGFGISGYSMCAVTTCPIASLKAIGAGWNSRVTDSQAMKITTPARNMALV